jgi:hypothetical protein
VGLGVRTLSDQLTLSTHYLPNPKYEEEKTDGRVVSQSKEDYRGSGSSHRPLVYCFLRPPSSQRSSPQTMCHVHMLSGTSSTGIQRNLWRLKKIKQSRTDHPLYQHDCCKHTLFTFNSFTNRVKEAFGF